MSIKKLTKINNVPTLAHLRIGILIEKATVASYWSNVNKAVKALGVSYKFMSEVTGIDYVSIIDWRAKKRMPNAEALVKISKFLNVSIEFLLSGEQKEDDKEQLRPCYQYLVPYINNADETGIALVERALGVPKNKTGGAEAASDSTHSMVG